MSIASRSNTVDTLTGINENKADFGTSTLPITKYNMSSDATLSQDELHAESIEKVDKKVEEPLSLSNEEVIKKEGEERLEKGNQNHVVDWIQSNENIESDESYHEKSTSFFDRLFHQLTRPTASESDYVSDRVVIQINQSDKSIATNHVNIDVNTTFVDGNQSSIHITILNTVRSFMSELNEEKNYLIGAINEETLVSRRKNRKFKSIISFLINNQTSYN